MFSRTYRKILLKLKQKTVDSEYVTGRETLKFSVIESDITTTSFADGICIIVVLILGYTTPWRFCCGYWYGIIFWAVLWERYVLPSILSPSIFIRISLDSYRFRIIIYDYYEIVTYQDIFSNVTPYFASWVFPLHLLRLCHVINMTAWHLVDNIIINDYDDIINNRWRFILKILVDCISSNYAFSHLM